MNDMLSPQSPLIEPPRRARITAISNAVQRRPIVLVLGMHRSGTSLCSHILSALGVDMSDDIDVNPSNAGGHWERREIVEFHDRILSLFNRDYSGHFHDFALPVAWWADPRVARIRREIVAFLEQRMGEGYFGFKDPRTVRLMPVWHQIFNELRLAPKIVLCLRNPAQIGRSLDARDGLDPEIGEYRWLVHMMDFYRYTSKYDFCTIEYESWFNNPTVNIERLQKFLDLSWQQSESDLALLLSDIVDPTARHDDANRREASQPLVRTLYKLAGRDGEDQARDQIAHFVSQFVSFQQLQRPLLRTFEDVAKTAAKFPETEKEAAALRAAVSERDAGIAAAESRANAAEARLADALAEIERQTAQIAEFGVALQAAQGQVATDEAALQRVRQEAQERDAASRESVAEAQRALQQRADETQSLQAEVATLHDALARAERAGRERADATEASQAEARTLRERLAKTEREMQEHATAAQVSEAEVGVLRGRLAQAADEATKRLSAVEAFQAEIAALQDTLTAARQVGKAAIAAFRLDAAAPVKSDSTGRWWRRMMRFFGG